MFSHRPALQLIVARYQENVDWLCDAPVGSDIVVYNKFHENEGHFLPNVGKEAHTYLHHIISNWENLPETMAFVQGNPFDHTSQLWKKLSNIAPHTDFGILSDRILAETGSGGPHAGGMRFDPWYKIAFCTSVALDYYAFGAGAQFVVSRQAVLRRPLSFYQHLLNISAHPGQTMQFEFPHAMERFWFYVFHLDHSVHPRRNDWPHPPLPRDREVDVAILESRST